MAGIFASVTPEIGKSKNSDISLLNSPTVIYLFFLYNRQLQHLICTTTRGQVYTYMSDVHTAGHEIIPPVP